MRRRDDFEHFPTRRRQVSSELMIFGGDARALELREMEALVCAREIKFRFCIKVKRVKWRDFGKFSRALLYFSFK